jgi:hypothetical protein
MKNSGLVLLSLIIGHNHAKGGLPSNDPVVAEARKQFMEGKAPMPEDLLGQRFRCVHLNARYKNDEKYQYNNSLSFDQFDGNLILKRKGYDLNGMLLTDTAKELVGVKNIEGRQNYLAYRIGLDGNLIGEKTFEEKRFLLADRPMISIDLPRNQRVEAYEVCLAE